MDDFIQINRINTQAMPGPNFAPGVTYNGGGLTAPVGGWVIPAEEQFPVPAEPRDQRPDFNYNPMQIHTAGNMWNMTRGIHPVMPKINWPLRRMQFDKGVTIVEAPGIPIKKASSTMDYSFLAAFIIGLFVILKSSQSS
jgi:hypothetical protein